MNKIKILDCTLRDGGYCNDWQFGEKNIRFVIRGLVDANVDIIELGYVSSKVPTNKDTTKYSTIDDVNKMIPDDKLGKKYVVMINYGEFDIQNIPERTAKGIDGIRVCFHKKDKKNALVYSKQLKNKGYEVFIQDMLTIDYSDEELSEIIKQVNDINPYAFYIVDSFGMIKSRDLLRLFFMLEHSLNKNIAIGFHSHNNMQLAYSNAVLLIQTLSNRNIIIDSSVYGMGRGAGNLNTELIIEYLNENLGAEYNLVPLLSVIDKVLNPIFEKHFWGYSLPNYISAKNNAHPNYAKYLDEKKTLTVEDIEKIFMKMQDEKKVSYDSNYIEGLYESYMASCDILPTENIEIKRKISNKDVLIIASGKSATDEKQKIIDFVKAREVITISVNHNYNMMPVDYIFVSNKRRYEELEEIPREKLILTTNIEASDVNTVIRYNLLTNENENVRDNAGLMAIKMALLFGASTIYLAGFDGYSHDDLENYGDKKMVLTLGTQYKDVMNDNMRKTIEDYSKEADIRFITASRLNCKVEK